MCKKSAHFRQGSMINSQPQAPKHVKLIENMEPSRPKLSLMRIQLQTMVRSLGTDFEAQQRKLNSLLIDFYQRMNDDLLIGFFFQGKDLQHIAHQQTQFLLNAAGMIEKFEGKGPHSAHMEMPPILDGHFDRRLVLLRETLKAHEVPEHMIELWISFESTFRNVVVSKN